MATASPTTATNATRRKGGKRPASEPTNGPSTISAASDGSGTSMKKPKIEPNVTPKTKIKKEPEEVSSTNKTQKKAKEAGALGDEQQDKENHDNRQTLVFNWTAEELTQLIGNLSNCLPKTDNVKYSTLIDKLDWEKVRFSPYTATECKDKWTQIMTRLRRFRTLTDMVTDAKEWLKHPWSSYSSSKKQKHPEMPKKPLTPYFRYFLEKRQKYSKEHPDMSMTDLAKVLSKKYQQLAEKKKQKYKETYERENEVYKQELEKFKKEHPDQFPSSDVKQQHTLHEGPNRPQTPFQYFFVDRVKKAEFADMDKREMLDKARKMWSSLSQAKKVKWIKKAEQEQQKYLMEVDEYCQSHPNYKPESFKSVLSKAEKEMKDRYDGKPEKPPNSGYSLFSRVMLRQLTDVPSKQKMSEISKRWKELGDKERLTYIDNAQKMMAEYRVSYANYLKNLPEEERQKLENETKNSKKKPVVETSPAEADEKKSVYNENDTEGAAARQKKPAVYYYQQEKITGLRQKHPELSKQELMKLLTKDYNELAEKKKEKYKKLAEETKQQDSSKAKNTKSVKNKVQETGSRKQRLYKGEPRKPPASGYSLFTTETLGSISEGDSKNRMAAVAAKWNTLGEVEKEKYKKRSREMVKKYKTDLAKFVAGLSEAEREEYNEIQSAKRGGVKVPASKPRKGQTPATKSAQTKHKKKAESESSDESSGDDEDDDDDDEEEGEGEEDDDDDDDEEDGSDKSGNEEESGSDESGSDSDDDENEDDDDDSDDDSDEEKQDGDNDSSSGESGSESDSNSGSSDNSSDSGSESDD